MHHLTGIPPSIKILNGEVVKKGDLAIAGGTYSDIWEGIWLGGEKVNSMIKFPFILFQTDTLWRSL